MGNEIRIFDFRGNDVRVVAGPDGQPWWVLADICRVLEIGNPSMVAARLDEDEKATLNNTEGGGHAHTMVIINESGLYSLILTSRKPEAKTFKKWVTSEVLPAIRKNGFYVAPASHQADEIDPVLESLRISVELRKSQIELVGRFEKFAGVIDQKIAALEEHRSDHVAFQPTLPFVYDNRFQLFRDHIADFGNHAESIRKMAKRFGVDPKQVQRWLSKVKDEARANADRIDREGSAAEADREMLLNIAARQDGETMLTIDEYTRRHELTIDHHGRAKAGIRLAYVCREHGINRVPINTGTGELHKAVNSYPVSLLRWYFLERKAV